MKTTDFKPNGLFHTPESSEELFAWIEQLSGSERIIAYTVSGMTWNLACELIKKALQHETESNQHS